MCGNNVFTYSYVWATYYPELCQGWFALRYLMFVSDAPECPIFIAL